MKTVIKRDGKRVKYERNKIENAILKAAKATGFSSNDFKERYLDRLVDDVEKMIITIHRGNEIHVEDIQDFVEITLMNHNFYNIAKNYIIYRNEHAKYRDVKKLYNGLSKTVNDYLDMSDWRVNENSNMSFSLQGLNNHIASEVTSYYWLHEIYPEHIREKHISGDLHIHDLANLSVYCCGWDLQDLLLTGFSGVATKTESKPPKHFRTALGQIVNFFYTLQGEAAGAQALSNFDTYLAPFIYYDNLTYEEVYQAMQEFIFNLNVPTRVGFQTPFTNITMDLTCPENMKYEPAIIGGEFQDKMLGEFQREMDMINRAFAEIMLQGDAKGRVFSFPIPTYNITKDFDWDNELLDPVWEMTAKYGIPYFANFVNSDMDPGEVRSMCCRLRLNTQELIKRGGGLFGSNPMTGSIGVVTLNLPRIGYMARNKEDFLDRVYELMDIAKESLKIKRKVLEEFTDIGLYPYSKFYLRNVKQRFGEYWKNHFNTIGINGMNEAMLNFMGKDMSDPEAIEFAEWLLDKINERLVEYQEETGDLFNLEATPAEGTSYRLARLDYRAFGKNGDFHFANTERVYKEGAEPYYTNSTQLPVGYTDDLFEALELQDSLQSRYTGGTVLHLFLGERMPNIKSTKKLVKRVAEKFHLPYYSITPTFSICPIHGYLAGEHEYCPICDKENGYNPKEEEG